MTRRQTIRRGVFLAVAMALGKLDLLKAENGELRVPLDQWHHVVFERHGQRVTVTVDEIFEALK